MVLLTLFTSSFPCFNMTSLVGHWNLFWWDIIDGTLELVTYKLFLDSVCEIISFS